MAKPALVTVAILGLMGINTLSNSFLLYKSKLVPRPLATLGLAGAALILIYATLVMFGVAVHGVGLPTILATPIGVYEMILAVWPISNGFNASAITSRPTKASANMMLSAS